jgi:hypothetical protein
MQSRVSYLNTLFLWSCNYSIYIEYLIYSINLYNHNRIFHGHDKGAPAYLFFLVSAPDSNPMSAYSKPTFFCSLDHSWFAPSDAKTCLFRAHHHNGTHFYYPHSVWDWFGNGGDVHLSSLVLFNYPCNTSWRKKPPENPVHPSSFPKNTAMPDLGNFF